MKFGHPQQIDDSARSSYSEVQQPTCPSQTLETPVFRASILNMNRLSKIIKLRKAFKITVRNFFKNRKLMQRNGHSTRINIKMCLYS